MERRLVDKKTLKLHFKKQTKKKKKPLWFILDTPLEDKTIFKMKENDYQ